ncbi:hypothetical protein ACKWTF_005147 [Chironomus riparius]
MTQNLKMIKLLLTLLFVFGCFAMNISHDELLNSDENVADLIRNKRDRPEIEESISEGPSDVIVYDDFDSSSNEVIVDSSEFSKEISGLESIEIVQDGCNDK